ALQQDEKRNEGGGGHVADGIDGWVEEGAHSLERSHQKTERHRDRGREHEPGNDPESAPAHVVVEAEIHHHVPPRDHHLIRAGHEESVLHQDRKQPPDADDNDEAAHREDEPGPPGNGLLRREVRADEAPASPGMSHRRRRSHSGRRDPAQIGLLYNELMKSGFTASTGLTGLSIFPCDFQKSPAAFTLSLILPGALFVPMIVLPVFRSNSVSVPRSAFTSSALSLVAFATMARPSVVFFWNQSKAS